MNQNTVKVETASTVTFLERETLAMLHNAFFAMPPPFYDAHAHRAEACLGAVQRRECSGEPRGVRGGGR